MLAVLFFSYRRVYIMKFILSVFLTAILAFLGGLWLPWWSIALAAFISALLLFQPPGKAFLAGFTGLFLLWGSLAWWIDLQNQGVLSKKIALILPLSGNSILLVLVTAFAGGFGACS